MCISTINADTKVYLQVHFHDGHYCSHDRRSDPEQVILNTTQVIRPGFNDKQRVEHLYQVRCIFDMHA